MKNQDQTLFNNLRLADLTPMENQEVLSTIGGFFSFGNYEYKQGINTDLVVSFAAILGTLFCASYAFTYMQTAITQLKITSGSQAEMTEKANELLAAIGRDSQGTIVHEHQQGLPAVRSGVFIYKHVIFPLEALRDAGRCIAWANKEKYRNFGKGILYSLIGFASCYSTSDFLISMQQRNVKMHSTQKD